MANLLFPSFLRTDWGAPIPAQSAAILPGDADLECCPSWPAIPRGMQGVQIVAIARTVERVCGRLAAATYQAEAIAAFDKRPACRPLRHPSNASLGWKPVLDFAMGVEKRWSDWVEL